MINLATKVYGSSLDALRAAFRALIIKDSSLFSGLNT